MAVRHGYGKIAGADALQFAYDTGDTRNSYKGEPTTNDRYADMTQWTEYAGSTTISTSTDGFYKVTNTTYNGEHLINQSFSAVDGGTYAFSVDVKPGLNLRYVALSFSGYGGWPGGQGAETYFDLQTGTYHGKLGSVDTDDYGITPNGDGSYRIYIVATRSGASTSNSNIFFFNSDPLVSRTYTGATNEYIFVRKPQLETKSHPTPYVAGTRSVSGSLLDLTGNKTIDISGVSFSSDAAIDFDGTNDFIVIPNVDLRPGFTLETVCYQETATFAVWGQGPTVANRGLHIVATNSYRGFVYGMYGNDCDYRNYIPSLNAWRHWVFTYDGTTFAKRFFADGVEQTPVGNTVQNEWIEGEGDLRLGTNYGSGTSYSKANGKIAVAKYYNRPLTDDEIRNNFRHYKTRFNI